MPGTLLWVFGFLTHVLSISVAARALSSGDTNIMQLSTGSETNVSAIHRLSRPRDPSLHRLSPESPFYILFEDSGPKLTSRDAYGCLFIGGLPDPQWSDVAGKRQDGLRLYKNATGFTQLEPLQPKNAHPLSNRCFMRSGVSECSINAHARDPKCSYEGVPEEELKAAEFEPKHPDDTLIPFLARFYLLTLMNPTCMYVHHARL
ncbi:MAG: hypothetical protein Q9219_001259 [cf. Caloplaca sp. 3 TL-2023]